MNFGAPRYELPQAQMHLLGAPSTVKYTPSKYTKLRVKTLAY